MSKNGWIGAAIAVSCSRLSPYHCRPARPHHRGVAGRFFLLLPDALTYRCHPPLPPIVRDRSSNLPHAPDSPHACSMGIPSSSCGYSPDPAAICFLA
jgi:hypothetical protein